MRNWAADVDRSLERGVCFNVRMTHDPNPTGTTDRAESGQGRVLVTGVTGYIGARLVVPLVATGASVRVLTRSPHRLQGRAWLGQVDVAQGSATDRAVLARALHGVSTAYYLLHSMDGQPDFERREFR